MVKEKLVSKEEEFRERLDQFPQFTTAEKERLVAIAKADDFEFKSLFPINPEIRKVIDGMNKRWVETMVTVQPVPDMNLEDLFNEDGNLKAFYGEGHDRVKIL